MLKINLKKNNDELIHRTRNIDGTQIKYSTNIIDYILVNWIILNEGVYLQNFKYNKIENTITFISLINNDFWCFLLKLPTNNTEIFYLMPDNTNTIGFTKTNESIKKHISLINEMNIHALKYEYDNFIEHYNCRETFQYEMQKSILTKYLNELNDKCCSSDTVEEDDFLPDDFTFSDVSNNSNSMQDIDSPKVTSSEINISEWDTVFNSVFTPEFIPEFTPDIESNRTLETINRIIENREKDREKDREEEILINHAISEKYLSNVSINIEDDVEDDVEDIWIEEDTSLYKDRVIKHN